MKLRSLAGQVLAAAFVVAGLGPSIASAQATNGAPTIPLLVTGDTGSFFTLDASKDTEVGNIYGAMESLVTLSPSGRIEPSLAESVSTPNLTTYIFHLRHGVRFWDGDEMTSADVLNALNYYRRSGSEFAADYINVKSVSATGPYTIVITLARPNAAFLAGLSEATPIFEKKFQEEHGANMGKPAVLTMGTGPFEIDSWDPTRGMQLSANPYWWGGNVPVKRVTVDFFTTETQQALAMRAGEIDVAFPTSAQSFAATAGVKVDSVPSLDAVSYFVMNPHIAPWNNIYVRRAVAYALDRQDIMNSIGNPAIPTSTFIPANQLETIASPGQVGRLLASVPTYQYNLTKAKEEMAQSPYPHGFSATTDTLQYGYYTPVCEAIVGELAKIGIKLSIKELTFNQWIAYAIGPKTYGNLYVDFNPAISDPSGMPDWILGSKNIASGEWNMADYDPPSLDGLIAAGIATNNVPSRLSIYGKIMRTVAADVPYVPLFVPDENVAVSSNFTIAKGLNIAFPYYQAWELYIRPR